MRYELLPPTRAAEVVSRGGELIDVRERAEFRNGTMPDAINVPLGELSQRLGELNRSRPVAVFCESGARSSQAANLLVNNGFDKVIDLTGGLKATRVRA